MTVPAETESTERADRPEHLFIEECDAVELVQRFGSPLFTVSEHALTNSLSEWSSALAEIWTLGPTRLLPSVKANTSLAVQRIVQQSGCGADTFGAGEYEITRRAGFDPALVSVNGQKTPELIRQAVADGARLTVDNAGELPEIRRAAEDLGTVARVRFRVRPPLDGWDAPSDLLAEPLATSAVMGLYKPGVPANELAEISWSDFGDNVELVGLHCHVARNTRDPRFWELAARETIAIADRLIGQLPGWSPRELDLGGGFPSPIDRVGQQIERVRQKYEGHTVPPAADYVRSMVEGLVGEAGKRSLDLNGVLLEIEPGRSVFGSSGLHFTTVMRRKRQVAPFEHQWVEVDTSTVHFGVEENNLWQTFVASNAAAPTTMVADVVGCSCQLDLIVPNAELPEVEVGDVLAFADAGAYQESSGSNFNALGRAAVVLVSGNHAEVIKRRETIHDVLGRDVIPLHLGLAETPR